MKTILILVDGMRPDSLENVKDAQGILKKSAYTLKAKTVMPSVTLPCHMSLFHSVDPSRHGNTTNIYTPQVRPIKGLCEILAENKKTSAFFYSWEELRDLARPGSLMLSHFYSGSMLGEEQALEKITSDSVESINTFSPDFSFIYMGYPDVAGHKNGWLSEHYMYSVNLCWQKIKYIIDNIEEDCTVIVTADHGGHDRTHGFDIPEDMTIPVIIYGKNITPGERLNDISIKDIAPTIVKILGVTPDDDWEGNSFI